MNKHFLGNESHDISNLFISSSEFWDDGLRFFLSSPRVIAEKTNQTGKAKHKSRSHCFTVFHLLGLKTFCFRCAAKSSQIGKTFCLPCGSFCYRRWRTSLHFPWGFEVKFSEQIAVKAVKAVKGSIHLIFYLLCVDSLKKHVLCLMCGWVQVYELLVKTDEKTVLIWFKKFCAITFKAIPMIHRKLDTFDFCPKLFYGPKRNPALNIFATLDYFPASWLVGFCVGLRLFLLKIKWFENKPKWNNSPINKKLWFLLFFCWWELFNELQHIKA